MSDFHDHLSAMWRDLRRQHGNLLFWLFFLAISYVSFLILILVGGGSWHAVALVVYVTLIIAAIVGIIVAFVHIGSYLDWWY